MENELLKAYAEVDKVLSFMENKYVEKIPKKMREMFKNEKLEGYNPSINPKVPLDEQDLQRKTLSILAMLNLNYWCESEEEKEELKKKFYENEKKYQEELREKYNPDNIFSKNQDNIIEPENNQTQLIEYKESVFRKILNKIREFLKIK